MHIVYVVATLPELPYPRAGAKERSEAFLEWKRLYALRLLEDQIWKIEELGGRVSGSHYREGKPEKEVILLAEEIDAGLIMTGGQRRPWFERIFGSGFSEIVSRKANRPVLVVSRRDWQGSAVPG